LRVQQGVRAAPAPLRGTPRAADHIRSWALASAGVAAPGACAGAGPVPGRTELTAAAACRAAASVPAAPAPRRREGEPTFVELEAVRMLWLLVPTPTGCERCARPACARPLVGAAWADAAV